MYFTNQPLFLYVYVYTVVSNQSSHSSFWLRARMEYYKDGIELSRLVVEQQNLVDLKEAQQYRMDKSHYVHFGRDHMPLVF